MTEIKPVIGPEGQLFEDYRDEETEEDREGEKALLELQAKDEFETGDLVVADYATDKDLATAIKNRVLELLDQDDAEDVSDDDLV